MNAYYPIAREEKFLYVCRDYFSIGFDESAIILDKNLRGYSNPCKTFNAPKLNNKIGMDTSFICINLEIYALNFYWSISKKGHTPRNLIMSFFFIFFICIGVRP